MKPVNKLIAIAMMLMSMNGAVARAQSAQTKSTQQQTAAAGNPVTGSGTSGQIGKWTGVSGSSTYTLGDSGITEDKFGKIGIGTIAPTSKLTVQGMIETTL